MNTRLKCLGIVSLFICASSMAMTINDLMPGKAASGQDLMPNDLKGKVVFVAYWGIDCPHCIAEIPQWDALYKKFHGAGFEIIGMERHHTSEASICALAKSRGLDFTLTMGGSLKGAGVTSIPHGFLFGPDGNLVQENPYSSELERKVTALMKEPLVAKAAPNQPVAPVPSASQAKAELSQVFNMPVARETCKADAESTEGCHSALGSGPDKPACSIERKAEEPILVAAKTVDNDPAETDAMLLRLAVSDQQGGDSLQKQVDFLNARLRGILNPSTNAVSESSTPQTYTVDILGGNRVTIQISDKAPGAKVVSTTAAK